MKRLIIVTGELLLISLILYESYLLMIPWSEKDLAMDQDEGRVEKLNTVEQEKKDTRRSVPPDVVASLFGWKKREKVQVKNQETVPKPVEANNAAKPEPINWLKPVGFASDSGSVKYHFFKDERTKRVLKLSVGIPDSGWKMIEANNNEFVFEFEGKLYSVKKNP
jgi:hypothetical protein